MFIYNIISVRHNSIDLFKGLSRSSFKPIIYKDYKKQIFLAEKKKVLLEYYIESSKTYDKISEILYRDYVSQDAIINCIDNTHIPKSLAIILDEDRKIGIIKNKISLFVNKMELKYNNEEISSFINNCLKERYGDKSNFEYHNLDLKIKEVNEIIENDLKKLKQELNDYDSRDNELNCINLISDPKESLFPNSNTINTYLIPEINTPKKLINNKSTDVFIKRLIEHICYLI